MFIEPQAVLAGPLLSRLLGQWFDSHQNVKLVPSYEPEHQRRQFTTGGRKLRILDAQPLPRYWFISEDERSVVQVQSDYLAIGWRRRDPSEAYIHYSVLRERFSDLLDHIAESVASYGASIEPRSAEITYINVIQPNSLWSRLSEVHKLLNAPAPTAEYERLSVSYSKELAKEGSFLGRLFVDLKPVMDWAKDEARVSLNLVAKSAELEPSSVASVFRFLDHAHDAANDAFYELLSKEARSIWGFA